MRDSNFWLVYIHVCKDTNTYNKPISTSLLQQVFCIHTKRFSKHTHTLRDMDDLELLQDLPKFNFPATIKIPSKTSKDNKDSDNDEGFSCSTPTSQEHKIPSVHDSPPPPPRKPRALPSKPSPTAALMIRSCKRKLLVSTPEIIMNREEIDRFFSSVYSDTSPTAKRRRRYLSCARR
ncbi:hypothetical protein Bca4012_085511 [Brassica carinata]